MSTAAIVGFSLVEEISLIKAAVDEAAAARIAVLLLPGVGTVDDLREARQAGASVARIATHCTEADVSVQHFGAARDLGMETVGFLMLAHRLDPAGLARQARIMVDAGAECVYVVDSAGALVLSDAQARVDGVLAAAEEVVRPLVPKLPWMDRSSVVRGYAGVYSSFLLHAQRAAERYGVPAHAILQRVGEAGYVGGQEDMIIDIALQLQAENAR